jgi:hypothetical protein
MLQFPWPSEAVRFGEGVRELGERGVEAVGDILFGVFIH